MNRDCTNTTARLFAAFAVTAVLLGASPVVRAALHLAKPCHEVCCQTQPFGHVCCGDETSHECLSVASCEMTVWLPPRTADDEPTPRGLLSRVFEQRFWQTESATVGRLILFARSNSLIEWHVRLQI